MGAPTTTPTAGQTQPASPAPTAAPTTLNQTGTPVPVNLIPVTGRDGKPVTEYKFPNGTKATIQGYDPVSGRVFLTCEDTQTNRGRWNANVTAVRGERESNPNVKNTVQHFRDEHGLLTITLDVGQNKKNVTLDDLKNVQKRYGYMHIVANTPEDDKAKEAAAKEDKFDLFQNPKDFTWGEWLTWALIAAGLTTIGILGFRKGGWFRSNKRRTQVTPSTPSNPDNPGTQIPDHEDEWGNNNTNTGNTTEIPGNSNGSISTPMDPSTNTGGTTIVQGGNQTLVNFGQSVVAGTTPTISGVSDRTGRG